MTTRELFGARGITFRGHRWFLNRYRVGTSPDARRTIAALGWVTNDAEGRGPRVGVSLTGPRHGLALFHTGETP